MTCCDGTCGSRAWNAPTSGLLFSPPPGCGGSMSRGSLEVCECDIARHQHTGEDIIRASETHSRVWLDGERLLARGVVWRRVGLAGGLLLDLVDDGRHDDMKGCGVFLSWSQGCTKMGARRKLDGRCLLYPRGSVPQRETQPHTI